jgi:hypothetical protein
LTLDGNLMAAEVKNGASLQAGVPRLLFETPARIVPINTEYCATGDGKKFLFREPVMSKNLICLNSKTDPLIKRRVLMHELTGCNTRLHRPPALLDIVLTTFERLDRSLYSQWDGVLGYYAIGGTAERVTNITPKVD